MGLYILRQPFELGAWDEHQRPAMRFLCWTCEDLWRQHKRYGRTRIPEGVYELGLRQEGGFDARYRRLFARRTGWHRGMVQLMNVPDFEYILVHIGNTDEDTEGCVLVGSRVSMQQGMIVESRRAYMRVYPVLRDAIEQATQQGSHARIMIVDSERIMSGIKYAPQEPSNLGKGVTPPQEKCLKDVPIKNYPIV